MSQRSSFISSVVMPAPRWLVRLLGRLANEHFLVRHGHMLRKASPSRAMLCSIAPGRPPISPSIDAVPPALMESEPLRRRLEIARRILMASAPFLIKSFASVMKSKPFSTHSATSLMGRAGSPLPAPALMHYLRPMLRSGTSYKQCNPIKSRNL